MLQRQGVGFRVGTGDTPLGFGVGQGTGDMVGFRFGTGDTLGTGVGTGDAPLGFWGGTGDWGHGGV